MWWCLCRRVPQKHVQRDYTFTPQGGHRNNYNLRAPVKFVIFCHQFNFLRHLPCFPSRLSFIFFILYLDNKLLSQILSTLRSTALAIFHRGSRKKKQCSKPQPGIGSVWKSIWGSVISPRVPVMISFWLRCVALFPFFPLSVFPICLWVSLSTKCELLFVPPYSPPLAFSPSYPLLFRAAFKLAECDW